MHDFVAIFGTPTSAELLGNFDYTLETGNPTPSKADPAGFFGLVQANPEYGQMFHATMASKARLQTASILILAAYDFSACEALADIGGGLGHLLRVVRSSREPSV